LLGGGLRIVILAIGLIALVICLVRSGFGVQALLGLVVCAVVRSGFTTSSRPAFALGAFCGPCFQVADNSLGRPLGLPCRSSVGCLD
jgi:hypothetical protein